MSTPEAFRLTKESLVSTVQDGQLTAENLSLEVGDVSFVYRRFGNAQTAAPALVMLQHFRGNLDGMPPGSWTRDRLGLSGPAGRMWCPCPGRVRRIRRSSVVKPSR